ncbi:MAG: hypothetical protein KIH69_014880 [Anaerolineae bacterium]|nr:hypothetical protein [Anaerolineae bacterium]
MSNTVNAIFLLTPTGLAQLPNLDLALIIIIFVVALMSGVLGMVIARLAYGIQLKKNQLETDEFRQNQHEAQMMVTKLQENEHQIKIQLEGQRDQVAMLRDQLQASQHTLEQAKDGWRSSVKEVQNRDAAIADLRAIVDSLQAQLVNIDQIARERNQEMGMLRNQLQDANLRNKELQRLASDRQAALSNANTDVGRFRARFAQVGQYVSDANGYVRSLSLQLEAIQQRVLDLDLGDIEERIIEGSAAQTVNPPAPQTEATINHKPTAPKPADIWEDLEQPVLSPISPASAVGATLPPMVSPVLAEAPKPSVHKATIADIDNAYAFAGRVEVVEEAIDVDDEALTPPTLPDTKPPAANGVALVEAVQVRSEINLSTVRSLRNVNAEDALKLETAGIVSVAQMAAATEAQLKQIIRAPRWRLPPYAEWIAEARELVGG